jgi:threonine dehydratase
MTEAVVAVDARDVYAARRCLAGVTRRTPLEPSPWLSDIAGVPVHLKLECWQRTGSFKLRGAYNAVAGLSPEELRRGVVAASAGNHGQGIALAAGTAGAAAVVFVPADAPAVKKERMRRLGATVREAANYDEADAEASRYAAATGARLVHPCADPAVVAGQGTIGLEIAEELPSLAAVITPVGGGGLASGIAIGVQAATAGRARVLGVQARRARVMYDSVRAGRVEPATHEATLADGLAGGIDPISLARVRASVDDIELVDEADIATAIAELYRRHGVVAEGAGATGVAAVMAGRFRLDGPTAIVVSGGNIDGALLARILVAESWPTS